ncbi:MAG: prolyl oligopeptidase family serine peptidase [Defluviitaleaceae bacterium]|nr:prolyl oligopeptidase family serine peptidase [Defluviitaleaceae bacterium]
MDDIKKVIVSILGLISLAFLSSCASVQTIEPGNESASVSQIVVNGSGAMSLESAGEPEPTSSRQLSAIDSLSELTYLPKIISSVRLSPSEIADTFNRAGIGPGGPRQEAEFDNVVIYAVVYETTDGAHVRGWISAPPDHTEVAYPILIMNRGGTTVGFTRPQPISDILARAIRFSDEGYISLQTYHREGQWIRRGGNIYFDTEHPDQWGGDDIYDILALMDLSELFNFRGAGLYMVGGSRGGMMTTMILRRDDRIDAAVIVCSLSDNVEQYNRGIGNEFAMLFGGTPEEVPYEWYRRDAVNWADEIDTPLLLLHGYLDTLVLPSQSQRVYELMHSAGRDVWLIIYDDKGHVFDEDMKYDTFNWLRERHLEIFGE